MNKKEIISITLPIEMVKELRELASANKRSLSSTIELFLEEALKLMNQEE